MKKVVLFCIPYAGASATVYNKWTHLANEPLEVCPLELAGRGHRFREPFYRDMEESVDDMYNAILPVISAHDYALFGHSLGSWIAFLLTLKIQANGDRLPLRLYLSGRAAPGVPRKNGTHYDLPTEELLAVLTRLGGTDRSLLDNRDFLDYYLPIIRADFRIIDTYVWPENQPKLSVPLSVFGGLNDEPTEQEMREWRRHTEGVCRFYWFEGGHFFIHQHSGEIMRIIAREIEQELTFREKGVLL